MKIARSELEQLVMEELQLMMESGEIDEGFMDRLKARGAGLKKAVGAQARGLGQRAAGVAKGGVAGLKGDVAGVAAAKAQRQAGKATQQQGAAQGAAKQKLTLIQSKFDDLAKDMTKMGLNMATPPMNGVLAAMEKAIAAFQAQAGESADDVALPEPEGGAPAGRAPAPQRADRTGAPGVRVPGVSAQQQEGKRRKTKKKPKTTRRKK